VGELVKLGAQRGRKAKPSLKLGVCGEHGGDPESIAVFYDAGLDYVSCSPFRVPIARLAAAQAVLGAGGGPGATASPDPARYLRVTRPLRAGSARKVEVRRP
jgi:pyruvate,orthophosphate dikinase